MRSTSASYIHVIFVATDRLCAIAVSWFLPKSWFWDDSSRKMYHGIDCLHFKIVHCPVCDFGPRRVFFQHHSISFWFKERFQWLSDKSHRLCSSMLLLSSKKAATICQFDLVNKRVTERADSKRLLTISNILVPCPAIVETFFIHFIHFSIIIILYEHSSFKHGWHLPSVDFELFACSTEGTIYFWNI